MDVPSRLVLFDGVCGLCDHAVTWLVDHDESATLRYAPLQGPTAAALRERHPEIPTEIDTMVFIEDGTVHLRSRAVLRILAHLPAPWRWAAVFRFLPAFLTDLGYRLVAASRYRLFGKTEACRLPAEHEVALFLD
jgi:predicted DCC family thiol-disulfide oxidoreductase YuxK